MEFSEQVKRFNDKAEKKALDVFRGSALEIFKNIIMRTPVLSGRLKANWTVSIGRASDAITDSTDKAGNKTISSVRKTTKAAKLKDAIYMTNNLPYAQIIENGSGARSPVGMVKKTIIEWNTTVNAQNKAAQ